MLVEDSRMRTAFALGEIRLAVAREMFDIHDARVLLIKQAIGGVPCVSIRRP